MCLVSPIRLIVAAALLGSLAAGCARHSGSLIPAPPITDPVVFIDDFGDGVDFQAFKGSKLDAVLMDQNVVHQGTAALKITVPAENNPDGGWAGGAFVTGLARELAGYDAVSFWAKASRRTTLNEVGFGIDNMPTPQRHQAARLSLQLDTLWTYYVIPIPLPEKLTSEKGLFYFSEAEPRGSPGYDLWIDDITYVRLGTITNPRPAMASQTLNLEVGDPVTMRGTVVTFAVDGADQTVQAASGYYSFFSSDSTVVAAHDDVVQVVGVGSAAVTAKLGPVDAVGLVTVNASAPPAVAAPTPAVPAADVISLFSNAYVNVPVDSWSPEWDKADVVDVKIAGNDTKKYTIQVQGYAGILFTSHTVDATAMTHFHMDVWLPTGSYFKVKLVDFGADGAYGGGDDKESELTFNAGTSPRLVAGTWVGLEVPLDAFTGLTTRAHLAQIFLTRDAGNAYVDNVYFHK